MSARASLAQIGKYPVVRKLGEGASSEVYLCHEKFDRAFMEILVERLPMANVRLSGV